MPLVTLPAVPSWAQLCVVHDALPSLLGQQSGCERGVCVCVCVCEALLTVPHLEHARAEGALPWSVQAAGTR